MSKGDFAIFFFQFALPIASMAIACVALYTINRSPMIERMKDENNHTKLLARVQELEGDYKAFEKGMDAALGGIEQKVEAVSDRLTAHQKRKRYYDAQDAGASGARASQQTQQALASAVDQGLDLSDTVAEPNLPGLEDVAPARLTSAHRLELLGVMKKRLRHGKTPPVNGAGVA